MKNNILRYSLVLGLITIISASILAYSYDLTKDRIKEAIRQDFLAGLKSVLPDFDNQPDSDAIITDNATVYLAKNGGAVVGYAVEAVSMKGYGGEISVIVGAKPDATIYRITVVRHTETPGLGDKIKAAAFTSLFSGGSLTGKYAVKRDGGDIDSFSGATISPRAVCEAVNNANKLLYEVICETK
ncbi:MAG: RnfABCDGE type electron transport complex subunit G [Deferribacteraceae bacterium]|jgi:electron transport complex protein RnfG|nr:RnfABCDGE type electron transport complex subunit G [Deferribacteraceae bacterium]